LISEKCLIKDGWIGWGGAGGWAKTRVVDEIDESREQWVEERVENDGRERPFMTDVGGRFPVRA
jgi:hypothetical protein